MANAIYRRKENNLMVRILEDIERNCQNQRLKQLYMKINAHSNKLHD